MTHDEIAHFLEDYRDGVIDPGKARLLAHEIRAGGPNADWVMEELAFSGWISEALSTLDADSFVRSFLERLYAERSADQFSSSLTTRLEKERSYGAADAAPRRKRRLPLAVQMLFGSGTRDAAAIRRQRTRLVMAASVLLVLLFAGSLLGIWLYHSYTAPTQTATLESASPGVMVTRDQAQVQAEDGNPIYQGDQVTVPPEGYARVASRDIGTMVLTSNTSVVFGPPPEAGRTLDPQESVPVLVEQGEVVVQYEQRANPCMINTPHGQIRSARSADFTVTVTAGSTRARVSKGAVSFTRYKDSNTIRVPAGHYAIATDTNSFEAREIR